MKVGILTYYNVHNHGALLQAYALQCVLREKKYSVEFLAFKRNYDRMPIGSDSKYLFDLSSIHFYFKYICQKGIGTLIYNFRKRLILNNFRDKQMIIKDRYSDAQVDVICVGSDEVFGLDVGINPFMYGHALCVKRIFSYAGSFGKTTLQDVRTSGCMELIRSGFQRMHAIGVRDQNSFEIVEKASNIIPIMVCDPVILYGYQQELSIAQRPVREKYILLYSYDKNSNKSEEIKAIRDFASRLDCKVYSIGYYHKWCNRNISVDPIELLAYVKFADYIVTDTFHGSVLSIITNKPFAAMLRDNGNKLKFLLSEYGLEDYIIQNYTELETVSKNKINFELVNSIIQERRKISNEFLNHCLEKII